MRCLVTGAAGFIGSHLSERLVKEGHYVVGVDSFTDYYPRADKLSNLEKLRGKEFELVEGDLNRIDLPELVNRVDCVFHLAAQPGVRPSWGASFDRYVDDNVRATQRLLEACKGAKLRKLVYSSSSSIYGNAESLPTREEVTPAPVSPYGVTKLAAEHLCQLYRESFGVPVVILRYFTAYGPRQRPDMGFRRFISKIAAREEIEVFGDGRQSRDFTFVDDIVAGTVLAMGAKDGSAYNVGSGRTVGLMDAISVIETECGRKARIRFLKGAAGDVRGTAADVSRIRADLGYEPAWSLRDGVKEQVAWQLGPGAGDATLNTSKPGRG